jgi:nucleotide-binding universal stress UspA family protein
LVALAVIAYLQEALMVLRPSVLCPIDFSNASRAALRHATAIAEHFGARLTLLTVNDPLMSYAIGITPEDGVVCDSERGLRRLFEQTFEHRTLGPIELSFEVAIGKPAPEILRVAREQRCDLIVMSSHGLTGVRKLFFGSTTERVLRETSVPVVVTPAAAIGPLFLEEAPRIVRRVLVPVDLSAATARQVQVARGLAEALDVPLLLTHVVEPVRVPALASKHVANVDAERRARAERAFEDLVATIPSRLKPEALVVYGDPAEEIAKVARDRQAGLIVMGLHSSPATGPRMGSVTYRVLCLTSTLVLALPPLPAPSHQVESEIGELSGTDSIVATL